jgi:hypothetical protein
MAEKEVVCKPYISISGSSNVNKFSFNNNDLDFDYIQINTSNGTPVFEKINDPISIPVKDFHCENIFMYNDFHELLNVGTHPNIIVELRPYSPPIASSNIVTTEFYITLLGVTHKYLIQCDLSPCKTNSSYMLGGSTQLNLSDFNISPPRKFLGTIVVKDEVTIDFKFQVNIRE